jgi:integral membrane protein
MLKISTECEETYQLIRLFDYDLAYFNVRGESMFTKTLKRFRMVGFIEGISYLVLLLIAMPLKYIYGMPEAVRLVGITHGALFTGYLILLAMAAKKYNWNIRFAIILFVASLIPFGTFYTDRKLKVLEEMLASRG